MAAPTLLWRNQVSAPLYPQASVSDTLLFTDPQNAARTYYLPRYSIAEENVSGQLRFRVELSQRELLIYLAAAPAPEVADAARQTQAEILPHELSLQLEFVERERPLSLAFQQILREQEGRLIRATLSLTNLEQVDQIFKALTDSTYRPTLSVTRTFSAAVTQATTRSVLQFGQGNAYVEIPHRSSLNLPSGGTAMAWFNTRDANANQKLFGKISLAQPASGWLMGVANGRAYVELWDVNGAHYQLVNADTQISFSSGQSVHLGMTWVPGGNLIAYINGQEAGRRALPAVPMGETNSPVRIGIAPWDPQYFHFQGSIRDVAVWNHVRTPEQIRQDMEQPPPTEGDGLVSFWALDEADGTQVIDSAKDWAATATQEQRVRDAEAQVQGLNDSMQALQQQLVALEPQLQMERARAAQRRRMLMVGKMRRSPFVDDDIDSPRLLQLQQEQQRLVAQRDDTQQQLGAAQGNLNVLRSTSGANHGSLVGPVGRGTEMIMRYQQQGWSLSATVDNTFSFSPQLYPYIFQQVQITPSADGLIRIPLQDGDRWYVYYQDERARNRFYYIPDSFALGFEQGHPLIALRFRSRSNFTLDDLYVEMDYIARPVVDQGRVERHATRLQQQYAPQFTQLSFPPMFDTNRTKYQLNSRSSNISNAPLAVSLQTGILDTVTFQSMEDFSEAWAALFSTSQIQPLLTGTVIVELQSGQQEQIPVRIRLDPTLDQQAVLDQVFQQEMVTNFEKMVQVEVFGPFNGAKDISVGSGTELGRLSLESAAEIREMVVDFGEQSVRLTTQTTQAQARVLLPLRDTILRTANAGRYQYSLNVITALGPRSLESLNSDDEILHIFVS
jgi:hypothetical protein